MDAQTRRERAYRHYVAKQMKKKQREMARAQKAANRDMKRKMKNLQPSEPKVTTTLEDFASYNAPSSEPAPAVEKPPFRETVVDPITVSAATSMPQAADPAPQQQ